MSSRLSSRLSEQALRASRVRLQQYSRAFLTRMSMGLPSSFEVVFFDISYGDLYVACFSLTFGPLITGGEIPHSKPV
jgi:hypothetical protein